MAGRRVSGAQASPAMGWKKGRRRFHSLLTTVSPGTEVAAPPPEAALTAVMIVLARLQPPGDGMTPWPNRRLAGGGRRVETIRPRASGRHRYRRSSVRRARVADV